MPSKAISFSFFLSFGFRFPRESTRVQILPATSITLGSANQATMSTRRFVLGSFVFEEDVCICCMHNRKHYVTYARVHTYQEEEFEHDTSRLQLGWFYRVSVRIYFCVHVWSTRGGVVVVVVPPLRHALRDNNHNRARSFFFFFFPFS